MADFSFRVRFRFGPRIGLNIDAAEHVLRIQGESSQATLRSTVKGQSIKDARDLEVIARGFDSEELAAVAGERWLTHLKVVFAKLSLGADYGERGPTGAFSQWFLEQVGAAKGGLALNDRLGVTVYETARHPTFLSVGAVTALAKGRPEQLDSALADAARISAGWTRRSHLAAELFNASFFERGSVKRFLLLVMAIEALLEPAARPGAVVQLVDELVGRATVAPGIGDQDRDALVGSLARLKEQSIGQAGKALAVLLLNDRKFNDLSPDRFFAQCYAVRSDLVHGNGESVPYERIGTLVATLEVFVSELLCASRVGVDGQRPAKDWT